MTPETLRAAERGLTLLVGAGFPVGRALDALNALTLFVVAHAASEVTTAAVNDAAAAGSQDYVAVTVVYPPVYTTVHDRADRGVALPIGSAGDAVRDEVPDLVGRHRPDVPG